MHHAFAPCPAKRARGLSQSTTQRKLCKVSRATNEISFRVTVDIHICTICYGFAAILTRKCIFKDKRTTVMLTLASYCCCLFLINHVLCSFPRLPPGLYPIVPASKYKRSNYSFLHSSSLEDLQHLNLVAGLSLKTSIRYMFCSPNTVFFHSFALVLDLKKKRFPFCRLPFDDRDILPFSRVSSAVASSVLFRNKA